ncbi:uncharacterized protein LOC144911834 isoform X2 [Branchiostoma floridae x Branchiostoma belcheri]
MQAATRKKRRSSSILKVGGRSPSRNVFQDLNGRDPLNLQEGQGAPLKRDPEPKSRRPSRRVSFADTYQVKEFLTEKDAASLGLWENSQTEDPGQPQDDIFGASAVEPSTTTKATISASGLDTLLNGPIKSPAAAQDASGAPEVCEPPGVSSSEESATQQTRTFDPEAENTAPLVDSKSFLARLMGGAGSQGNNGSPDLSMSCSSHTFNNTIIFGQDPNVTSSLDMTCLDETFASQEDVILDSDKSTTAQQQDRKGTIDAGSFLFKFMQQKPAQTEDRPVSSGEHTVVFGPGDHDDMDFTVAFSSRRQTMGLEKEGETQRQVGVAALSVFNEEKTTVFSNMEPDADMDFTSTINSISSSQETAPVKPAQRTEEPDKTIIFSNTHTGADMDFTTTIKSMKMAQENVPQQPTSMAQKPIEDKTTIFGEVESGADMEFTTVISSDGAGEHVPDLTSSVQPQEPAQDKTVVFSNVESSAEMEFTTTISSSAEAQEQVPGSACRPVPQEATQDRTTVFTDAELGGDMEFTVAVDSLRPGTDSVSSHAPPILCEDANVVGDMEFTACVSSLQTATDHREATSPLNSGQPAEDSPEKTKILDVNTQDGDMELTTVIPEQKVGNDSQPPAAANTEETRVFSTEDAGGMELTCQFDLTGNQKKPSKLNKLKRRLSEVVGETTRVFGGEDTAMMDLTVGIGSVMEPQISSGNDMVSTQDRAETTGGEKTARMDLTVGVGSILNIQRLSEEQDGDKTRVFGRESTARMDLTQGFGGILASACTLDGNNKLDPIRGVQEESMPVQQHNNGSSKSLPEERNSGMVDLRSTKEATDRTQVFGADDGGMEMTRCHTGVLSEDANLLISAKRRKTTAQQKRVSFGPSQTLVTATSSLPTMTTLDMADKTKIFGSDTTACMDVTSCNGGILGQNVPQVTRETPARPLYNLADLTTFQQLSKSRSSLPLLRSRTSLVSVARRASTAAVNMHMAGPQPDSDSTASPQKEETPEPVVTILPAMEKVLEIATTPPASDSNVAVEETRPKSTEADVVAPAVENRPPVPPLSIASATGDDRGDPGIISPEFDLQNEQLELVETTAEFLAAVCQENLTLPPTRPPVMSQGSSTLHSDLSQANSTLLDVTCRSNSSSDRSALGATAMEGQDDMTLPQQGRLSVSQFLTYCNIVFQDQGKDRRSVMPLIKSDPPEILYEHLEILSILLPQAHMYEWSCNKLQEHIGSTRQLVKQQEQRLDQENPALFLEAQKMIQDGKLKEVDDLKKDMESLRSCCKKQAKTEWHEWNCKMTGAIVESLKEEYADMKTGVEELDASLQKIDQSLATLDDVEKDLEDAIANLEGMTLPSDEDIQRYKEQQAVLLQKEEELASSCQEQEHLKSTLGSLQQERESLELQVDQLQLQERELGLQQEGEDSTAVEEREEQVRALNRLQGLVEWDLEELTDSQLCVTFLQKSLLLTVAYAGVKDDHQKIADIRFESLLADEAAPWAHLCHHMVLGALDQPQLVHTYPTFPTQSKLLHRVSLLVSEARRLGDEVQEVILRHPFTTVDGTDLTVEFSNVEAHAKFFVTFSLTPGAYPNQVMKCTCTHRIGAISPSAVESALCAIPAGSLYLSRLVQCVEELIQQHASSLHQTNTTHRDL